MKSIKLSFIPFVLLGSLLLFGCEVNDSTTNGNAHISVKMTDAPAAYDAVYVDVQSIQIKTADYTNAETDENGWITLNDEPTRVNLLKLRNGNTIQLGDEDIQAGTYSQIRLVLGSDNEVVIDGTSQALTTPSAQQSGLKLNIDADIAGGEVYNLLVDFDASQSIVVTGNQKFMLKPVLRAVHLEETGSISGMVKPADAQTAVMAINNGDTLSTITDSDGQFSILGVTSGDYDVMFDAQSEMYADTTLTAVTVVGNEDVDLGTITLSSM